MRRSVIGAIACLLSVSVASALSVTFNAASDVPVTAAGFTASDQSLTVTLNFAPSPGTNLMVVKNTGSSPIAGAFTNLAQSANVTLVHAGLSYQFIASYFGGTGNDLVLLWPGTAAFAWGFNYSGQLGDGTTDDASLPIAVVRQGPFAETTLTAVAGASFHSLSLAADGKIYGWGYNGDGELGDGSVSDHPLASPAVMDGALNGKTVIALARGSIHSLALTSDGQAFAWGYNGSGQLGDGTYFDHSVPNPVDASGVLAGKTLIAVAAGDDHSLALADDGTVYTWGRNDFGQLGNGSTVESTSPVAVTGVLVGKTVVAIGGGHTHSLALTADGKVYAWGYNQNGQLGNGTSAHSSVPVSTAGVLAGKTVTAIATGGDHNVALTSEGLLFAWGRNDYGQLGDDSNVQSNVPVAVDTTGPLGGKIITAISAGHTHSLALASTGELFAWGNNTYGQLGNGMVANRPSPVAVNMNGALAGKVVTSIACGGNHTLVLAASPQAPDIAVDQPAGNGLIDSISAVNFGSTTVGNSFQRTFTIRNAGSADLTGLAITKSGPEASEFVFTNPAVTTLASGASTTFTVTFTPGAAGARGAAIHIASNDADESPFDIWLSGAGFTDSEAWRQAWFGTPLNSGNASDNADPDHDGVTNIFEFATHQNPTAVSLPVGTLRQNGDNLEFSYTCDKVAINEGIAFGVEWTDNLVTGPWSTADVTTTVVDHVTTETVTATLPTGTSGHRYVRLRVVRP